MENKTNSFIKDAGLQVLAGGSAGFVEVCIMQPLDVIKTRFQVQSRISSESHVYYNGLADCFKKMYRAEGLSAFYKGILPPILVESPKRAWKFLSFEQFKKLCMFGADKPTPITYSLAGLAAGITEGILVNPFEVIKVSLQTNRIRGNQMPSTWDVTRSILHNEGYKGLCKGISAAAYRNGVFNMVYFGFYHSVKDRLPKNKDSTQEFFYKVVTGFASGVLGCLANIPFDVAKSRIQGPQPSATEIKYRHTFKTINTIYKEEGFRALYKGLVPKVLRLGPGGAIMLLVYDYAYAYLQTIYL